MLIKKLLDSTFVLQIFTSFPEIIKVPSWITLVPIIKSKLIELSLTTKKTTLNFDYFPPETMESVGFERRTSRFETGDITSELLMLDYITIIFMIYTLSHLVIFLIELIAKCFENDTKIY